MILNHAHAGRRRRRNQRGVSAVIFAVLFSVLMAAGAVGFDIAKLVYERQQVRAAVDAAAQIGAAKLSASALGTAGASTLRTLVQTAAVANYGNSTYGPGLTVANVSVNFYCVVSTSSVGSGTPKAAQIPSTCNPNPPSTDYTTGTKCSTTSCAIPCKALTVETAVCNAIQVSASKVVQFVFGPAINISTGSAAASTISCQGTCGGQAAPNPMNVVLMADRTPSMSSDQLSSMKSGITSMLGAMNQDQQYVAFGAIGISATTSSTTGSTRVKAVSSSGTAFSDADSATYPADTKGVAQPTTWSAQSKLWHFKGTWVPIAYTNKYQKTTSGTVVMDTSTQLGSAVSGLAASSGAGSYPSPWHISNDSGSSPPIVATGNRNYKASDTYGQSIDNYGNTHLASALKAAARYVVNTDPASLSLPDRTQYGTPRNVVIFETDGAPREVFNSSSTALSLDNDYDIGATNDTVPTDTVQQACDNFTSVATAAKAKKILLIMIAVGDAADSATTCGSRSVAQMMAAAASPKADGTASDAAASCDSSLNRTNENADGDNFYCASDADELKSVFSAAMGNITGGTKFMSIDGVGD